MYFVTVSIDTTWKSCLIHKQVSSIPMDLQSILVIENGVFQKRGGDFYCGKRHRGWRDRLIHRHDLTVERNCLVCLAVDNDDLPTRLNNAAVTSNSFQLSWSRSRNWKHKLLVFVCALRRIPYRVYTRLFQTKYWPDFISSDTWRTQHDTMKRNILAQKCFVTTIHYETRWQEIFSVFDDMRHLDIVSPCACAVIHEQSNGWNMDVGKT